MERDLTERKEKAAKRALQMGARKLALPDVRRLLEAHFGDAMTARCGHQPCANFVNAAKTWIVAKDDYSAGMDELQDCARVVCPTHAKHSLEPVRQLFSVNLRLVELWLYRVGWECSRTTCAICGICPLRLWGHNVEVCHLVSYAIGVSLGRRGQQRRGVLALQGEA